MAKSPGCLFFAYALLIILTIMLTIIPAAWAKPIIGLATPANSFVTVNSFPFHYHNVMRVYNNGNETGRFVIKLSAACADTAAWITFESDNFTLQGGASRQIAFYVDADNGYNGTYPFVIQPTLVSGLSNASQISAAISTSSIFEFHVVVPEKVGNMSLLSLGTKPGYNSDLDGDGIVDACDDDIDGDGTANSRDYVTGESKNVESNVEGLLFKVNGTTPPNDIGGVADVTFVEDVHNKTLIEFEYNFTPETALDLSNVSIFVNTNSSVGSIIIKGIDLTSQGGTKTAYVDNLDATTNTLCIIDDDVDSIVVVGDCENGNKITCPGISGLYTCKIVDNGTRYKVAGLRHSAVTEYKEVDEGGGGGGGAAAAGGGGGGGGAGGAPSSQWSNLEKKEPPQELPPAVEITPQQTPVSQTQKTTAKSIEQAMEGLPQDTVQTLQQIEDGISSKEFQPATATKTLELNMVREGQQITFESQMNIKVVVPEDADSVRIIEIIPADMAKNIASVKIEGAQQPNIILSQPPVLEWTINNVKKGEEINLRYSVPVLLQGISTKTVVAYSNAAVSGKGQQPSGSPVSPEVQQPGLTKFSAATTKFSAASVVANILPYALLAVVAILLFYLLTAMGSHSQKKHFKELQAMLREATKLVKQEHFEKAASLGDKIEASFRKLSKQHIKDLPRLKESVEKIREAIRLYRMAYNNELLAKANKFGKLQPKLKRLLEAANMLKRNSPEFRGLYEYAIDKHDYCIYKLQKKKEPRS